MWGNIITQIMWTIWTPMSSVSPWMNYSPSDSISFSLGWMTIAWSSTVTGISTNWRVSEWLKLSAFFAWFMHVVCLRTFGLLEIRFQRPWIRILHSAEEDNYSPSDSISFPCCQCIKISTNKHVSVLMYVYMQGCQLLARQPHTRINSSILNGS